MPDTPELTSHSALVDTIAKLTDLPRTRVQDVIQALAAVTTGRLADGGRVRIAGIGIFSVSNTPARSGTGPNGEPYESPGRRRVTFRPAADLTRFIQRVEHGNAR